MAASAVANIKLQPVNVTWEIEQQTCVQTVDQYVLIANTFFSLYGGTDGYYVWMNLDAGGADPVPGGGLNTGIEVAVTTGDSAATIATAIAAAVDAEGDFGATASGDLVTITNADVIDVLNAGDLNDTLFTVSTTQEGGSLDLGLLEGDVESTFEEQLLDITAHQTGTTVLSQLRQGVSAEISLVMEESDTEKYKEIFAHTGGEAFVADGGSGTEVYGWGTSRQGTNVIVQSRRLRLHPVNAPDNLEDLTFWKAYPKPESIVYSGENPKTLSVTFSIFRDENRDDRISYFIFGDATQNGL